MINTYDILAIKMLKGIGDAYIRKNLSHLKESDSADDFLTRTGKVPEDIDKLPEYIEKAQDIIKECSERDIIVFSLISDKYPKALLDISDAPAVLFAKGNIQLMENCIAIIGTRHSSELGNNIARRISAAFINDYAICNGLVEGIDENAIRPDEKISSRAVGIISGGIFYEETCSRKHKELINEVVEAGGLILSEMLPHQKEDSFSGSKVSRIQSGISKGLVLIQSSVTGGSKYTLKAFSKLNRPLGVVCYDNSPEYMTDIFSANRIILEKGIEGMATMIGVERKNVHIGKIIRISGKKDYETFKNAINNKGESLFD